MKDKEAKKHQMVDSLLDTLKKGKEGEIRSRPVEPKNTLGTHLALSHKGQPHKGKIVEHKIEKNGNPITFASYAHEHGLTNYDGWKWARKFTKNHKKFVRLIKIY